MITYDIFIRRYNDRNMNKHTVITSIAIAIIIIPFAYSGLNIYAVEQVQYKWADAKKFNFFAMSNNGMVEFCNPNLTWTHIKDFQIDLFYDVKNLGTFKVTQINAEPTSSTLEYGKFISDSFVEVQHVFMTLDHEFDDGNSRLDPTKMYVQVTMNTPILGLIPYATSSQYTGFDFDMIMKGDGYEC